MHVGILGSGISGLSLAYELSKEGIKVTLLEKKQHFGGYIQTINDEFLFELGPRTFKPSRSMALLELIDELGLSDQLIASDPASSDRYILQKNGLVALPKGPLSFLTSPLTKGLIFPLLKEWMIPYGAKEDETIYDFISRRLNSKVAKNLFDPMTTGIYAGDIESLSIKSCFPILYELEKEHHSLSKGLLKQLRNRANKDRFIKSGFQKGALFSLKNGLQTLVDTLVEKINGDLLNNAEIISLRPKGNRMEVETTDNTYMFDHVFSALPPKVIGKLLQNKAFSYLNEMKVANLAIVCLGYKKQVLIKKGFGYLIPTFQKEYILGAVFDSCIFPNQNKHNQETRITVMIGGIKNPEVRHFSKDRCVEIAIDGVKRHLGIRTEPEFIHPMIVKDAIAQFEVGHSKKISLLQQDLQKIYPQISLIGNYLEGVAVNDCVEKAKKTASNFLEKIGSHHL